MTDKQLFDLLKTAFTKVAYNHFDKKVEPPFVLFRNTDTTSFNADDKTFWKDNNYIVDLVTDTKSPSQEATIESLFDDNYLPYAKEEDFIESEKIYQIRYYI